MREILREIKNKAGVSATRRLCWSPAQLRLLLARGSIIVYLELEEGWALVPGFIYVVVVVVVVGGGSKIRL